jgi:hypothetical protein
MMPQLSQEIAMPYRSSHSTEKKSLKKFRIVAQNPDSTVLYCLVGILRYQDVHEVRVIDRLRDNLKEQAGMKDTEVGRKSGRRSKPDFNASHVPSSQAEVLPRLNLIDSNLSSQLLCYFLKE